MPDLGITKTSTPGRDQKWRGSKWGSDMGQPVAIPVALLSAGKHYDTNGVVPEGLALGKAKTGAHAGKYGPFDPAATDGREVLSGFLTESQQIKSNFGGISTQVLNASQQVVGLIRPEFVPNKPVLNTATKTTGQFVFLGVDYVAPTTPAAPGA